MASDVSFAESQLELVGMDAGQAAAYVRLAVGGPMRAAQLADALRVSRQDAYRMLHAMIARGFVVSDLGHPASFSATPPSEIFARAIAAQEARTEQLGRADERVTEALAALRPEPIKPATPGFAIVRGRHEVLARSTTLLQGATRELRLLSTHEATMNVADLSGILQVVMGKALAGVHVRAIVRPAAIDPRFAAVAAANVELRTLDREVQGGMAIADDAGVMLSFVTDRSTRLQADADIALWSDARDLIALQTTLFDALWEQATTLAPRALRAPTA